MSKLENSVVDNFIIDTVLVSPIEKISSQLNNNEFRDCDIKWLDTKMKNFIVFAGETLNVKAPVMAEGEAFELFNEYVKEYYTKRFTTLLDYFKSF